MRTKKFAVIVVAIVFVLVMFFSCIALFSVKKINVNYAVGDNTDTASVQAQLDKFLGKNLLFLNTQELENSLSEFYYMDVVSVNKHYPNQISVDIKERREVYDIVYQDKAYVTADSGFVLRTYDLTTSQANTRERIKLELSGVEVSDGALGKDITTDSSVALSKVFEMAKEVELTNCIKSIKLEKTVLTYSATFYTHTGVSIIVREILDDGVEKVKIAFEKYDQDATDFEKTFQTIEVVKTQSGEIQAVWTGGQG